MRKEQLEEVKVKIIKINRKDWLKDMPELIKNLKINYGFYFPTYTYGRTQKRIVDLVKEKQAKNRHKIILYTNYEDWYFHIFD